MSNQSPKNIKKQHSILITTILFAVIALIAVVFLFVNQPEANTTYRPPEYEANAQQGIPNPPPDIGYREIQQELFKFSISGIIQQQPDSSINIYLTNPKDNEALLLCRVTDRDGNVLYMSGLLEPGRYIEKLPSLVNVINGETEIMIEIFALDIENYHSLGTAYLQGSLLSVI